MLKKGQSLSFDAIVATALFIFLLGSVVLYTYDLKTSSFKSSLNEESIKLSQTFLLSTNESGLLKDNIIDEDQYYFFKEKSKTIEGYNELKSLLGVFDDFCVYMVDEQGNIILLDSENSSNFGSEKAVLSYTDDTGTYEFKCNQNIKEAVKIN